MRAGDIEKLERLELDGRRCEPYRRGWVMTQKTRSRLFDLSGLFKLFCHLGLLAEVRGRCVMVLCYEKTMAGVKKFFARDGMFLM